MTEVEPAAKLQAFLDDHLDAAGSDAEGPGITYQALYVEEPVLGQATSRFAGEGGVRLNGVRDYAVTPEDLGPFEVKRRGLADVQTELLRFRFTIDEPPIGRSYASVTIRITLDPVPTVLLFDPDKEALETKVEGSSGSEFTLAAGGIIQMQLAGRQGKTVRRTERYPVTTALDLRERGFGWKLEARDGAPLFAGIVETLALIEVPRGTTKLNGKFDCEAMIERRLLGTSVMRRAAPVDSDETFIVDLTA